MYIYPTSPLITQASLGTQTPPQSFPPLAGSQSSRGSSTHFCPSGHLKAAMPPQKAGLLTHTLRHGLLSGMGTQTCPTIGQGVTQVHLAAAAAAETEERVARETRSSWSFIFVMCLGWCSGEVCELKIYGLWI